MAERLAIAKENGENLTVEFVSCFAVPEIQKHFLITTSNEIDPNGLVVLNVSEIQNNKLTKVQSDDDWSKIKQVMRSIISSSLGEFKYLPIFADVNASIEYARNISVQGVAKDQLIKDYYEKKPVGGASGSTTVADEPVSDVPLNPALGNVPAPIGIGGSEIAPGIVEVNETEQMINDQGQSVEDSQKAQVTESPMDLINSQNSVGVGTAEQPIVADSNGVSPTPVVLDGGIAQQPVVNQPMVTPASGGQNLTVVSGPQEVVPQMIDPTMQSIPVAQQMIPPVQPMVSGSSQMGVQPVMSGNLVQPMATLPSVAAPTPMAAPMNIPAGINQVNNGIINFDQIVAEAKEVFLESSKNLADVIIANAFESIRMKEEELRNREIIVAQREAAVNQQTMMSMNQMPYGQVPVNTYQNSQTQV